MTHRLHDLLPTLHRHRSLPAPYHRFPPAARAARYPHAPLRPTRCPAPLPIPHLPRALRATRTAPLLLAAPHYGIPHPLPTCCMRCVLPTLHHRCLLPAHPNRPHLLSTSCMRCLLPTPHRCCFATRRPLASAPLATHMALATRTARYPHRTAATAAAAHTHRPRATAPLAARTTPLLATRTAAAHTHRTAPYPHRLLPAPHRHCCPYLPPAFYPHRTAEQPIPTTRALLLATRTAASHIRPTAHDPHHSIPAPLATCTAPPLLLPICYCPAHYPHYTTARYPHRAAAAAHTRRLLATRTAPLLLPIPTTRTLLLATRTATAHTRPTAHNPPHSIPALLAIRTAPPLLLPACYCPARYPRHTIACYPHCTAAAAHTRCPLTMHHYFSPTARRCFPPHCTSAPPLATNFTQAAAHR